VVTGGMPARFCRWAVLLSTQQLGKRKAKKGRQKKEGKRTKEEEGRTTKLYNFITCIKRKREA